jgi:hypothetical protein
VVWCPAAVADIRRRLAERLGDISRQVDTKVTERTARLERTEERSRNIIAMQIDGDRSPHVAQMRKDLETQAASEGASVDALRARASGPLELSAEQPPRDVTSNLASTAAVLALSAPRAAAPALTN